MKPRFKSTLLPLLLFAGAIIVFLNAWWAFQAVRTLATNAFWLAHSWQVVHQVERVLGSTVNAETGERGYLISGMDSYLEPYTAARQELPGELAHLQSLTSDNPSSAGADTRPPRNGGSENARTAKGYRDAQA